MASVRTSAFFFINGIAHEVSGTKAGGMLADYLRTELQLCGTKIVCAEGDCGACTVLRWHPYPKKRLATAKFQAINSCITTVAQMDGSSLVTIEGLKSANRQKPTSVQNAMVSCHGSQCGYCTPGFVMALTALAERRLAANDTKPILRKEAQNYLTGNLCRCTGYEPILNAAQEIPLGELNSLVKTYLTPSIRKTLIQIVETPLEITDPQFTYFAPTKKIAASKSLAKNKECRLLASGTDLGVLVNKLKTTIPMGLSLKNIAESHDISYPSPKRIKVGCSVSIAELRREIEHSIPEFSRFLDLFASPQIKNLATLVGNIANASPIADTAPFLLVAETLLHLESVEGKRTVPLAKFYVGYKKTLLKRGEWISGIEFDIPHSDETLCLFKSSQRKDLDISCVNLALRLSYSAKSTKPEKALLAVGGVGPVPLRLPKTEKLITGMEANANSLPALMQCLQSEINPLSDLRGSAAFRRITVQKMLEKYLNDHWNELKSETRT